MINGLIEHLTCYNEIGCYKRYLSIVRMLIAFLYSYGQRISSLKYKKKDFIHTLKHVEHSFLNSCVFKYSWIIINCSPD